MMVKTEPMGWWEHRQEFLESSKPETRTAQRAPNPYVFRMLFSMDCIAVIIIQKVETQCPFFIARRYPSEQ